MLAQAPAVELDLLAILFRVLHTTCAGTLLGGLVYMRFVLAPAAASDGADIYAGRRAAWAKCVGVCTALLLASGSYNFWVIITQYQKPAFPYHMVFGIKILLAFAVFALMALLAGKTDAAAKLQAQLGRWLNITLAMVLAIFLLGAVLKSIPKVPAAAEPAATPAPAVE